MQGGGKEDMRLHTCFPGNFITHHWVAVTENFPFPKIWECDCCFNSLRGISMCL